MERPGLPAAMDGEEAGAPGTLGRGATCDGWAARVPAEGMGAVGGTLLAFGVVASC